jgi:hypothetical protein
MHEARRDEGRNGLMIEAAYPSALRSVPAGGNVRRGGGLPRFSVPIPKDFQMLRHIAKSAVMALTIGGATLVAIACVIDGSPMLAAALIVSPFVN